MKYIVSLKSVKDAPVGFETPAEAVAHFLLTNKLITPESVCAEMSSRIKASKHKRPSQAKPVLCVETGETYPTVTAACQAYGCHVANVLKTGKTAKGLHFKYMDK